MKIGFIGLGNVGGKLANNLLNNQFDITVLDKDEMISKEFQSKGSKISDSIQHLVENSEIIITCLPSPEACKEVLESENGIIRHIKKNQIWIEMSTTDEEQLKKHASLIERKKEIGRAHV